MTRLDVVVVGDGILGVAVPPDRCGKIIVATRPSELPALDELPDQQMVRLAVEALPAEGLAAAQNRFHGESPASSV